MDTQSNKSILIYFLGILLLLTGCGPGPPLPPIRPVFEWLFIALVVYLGVFSWKKYSSEKPAQISEKPVQTDDLGEALHVINQQLKELEKKIDELREKQDQGENS